MRKILIEGMICSKCTDKIEKKLRSIDGVEDVKVLLDEKEAYVSGDVDEQVLKEAIESEGYEVTAIEPIEGIKHPEERKGFFRRPLKRIENSNEDTFGPGDLHYYNSKKKEKEEK
ncbi:heavy metal-associated domain-containing protein [Psychrilyobacter sp.]|uniref:heavy-metal-associated domain-containing protein n=1 Tax=Psychrilyobacter sp. TaxID=2586924 RepID=UPI003019F9A2